MSLGYLGGYLGGEYSGRRDNRARASRVKHMNLERLLKKYVREGLLAMMHFWTLTLQKIRSQGFFEQKNDMIQH